MPATSEPAAATDRLVFLHGFTQTHHHWHRGAQLIAERLGNEPTLAFVDLPGHGLSSDDRTGITDSGRSLARLAGAGTYIGYSMGGRFGLVAALAGPEFVERLVLIGATPGIDADAERSDRRRLDGERARRLEQIGLDRFLDEWLSAPMFAALPTDGRGLEHRRRNSVEGLAHSLRSCGTGSQVSLWQQLVRIEIPVLVIAGELDLKFNEIGRRMTEALPDATFASIGGAGHAAHSEQPDQTAGLIADWLTTGAGRISRAPARH